MAGIEEIYTIGSPVIIDEPSKDTKICRKTCPKIIRQKVKTVFDDKKDHQREAFSVKRIYA